MFDQVGFQTAGTYRSRRVAALADQHPGPRATVRGALDADEGGQCAFLASRLRGIERFYQSSHFVHMVLDSQLYAAITRVAAACPVLWAGLARVYPWRERP